MISPLRSIIIFRKELSLPSDFLGTLIISSRVVLNSRRSGRRSDGPTRPTRLPLNPSTIHMLSDRFAILSNNPIITKQLGWHGIFRRKFLPQGMSELLLLMTPPWIFGQTPEFPLIPWSSFFLKSGEPHDKAIASSRIPPNFVNEFVKSHLQTWQVLWSCSNLSWSTAYCQDILL